MFQHPRRFKPKLVAKVAIFDNFAIENMVRLVDITGRRRLKAKCEVVQFGHFRVSSGRRRIGITAVFCCWFQTVHAFCDAGNQGDDCWVVLPRPGTYSWSTKSTSFQDGGHTEIS